MLGKRSIFLVGLMVLALGLAGCFPSMEKASFSSEELKNQLISGITTQEEVRKLYGEPTKISRTNEGETWTYIKEASKTKSFFADMARSAGVAAVGQAGAKVGMAAMDKGGVVGGTVASSAVTRLGTEATENVAENIESTSKTLIIYFNNKKIVKKFLLN